MRNGLTETSSREADASEQTATTHLLRERMRQFYETSEAYKALLAAHDESYLRHYVGLVTRSLPGGSDAKRRKNVVSGGSRAAVSPSGASCRILDLGCGNGISSRLLNQAGHDVVGTDISPLFLEEAWKWENARLKYHVCDVLELPFESDSFDVICSNELIEHLPDVERCLSEMIRVARTGGRIVLSGPNLCSPLTPFLDWLGLICGKSGRPVWGETKRQALEQFAKNWRLSFKKRFSKRVPQFIYRNPDLQRDTIGGDSDSAYYASPVDLVHFFRLQGCAIVKKCVGFGIKGSLIAATVPYLSPYISMVVEK